MSTGHGCQSREHACSGFRPPCSIEPMHPSIRRSAVLVASFLTVTFHTSARSEPAPMLASLTLPRPADSVDASSDTSGTLHVALVREGRCWYQARTRDGGEFTSPRPVDPGVPPIQVNRQFRPRIHASPKGTLWILWQEHPGMKLMRSKDSGTSWQSVSIDRGGSEEIDVPAMGIGPGGQVAVVWVDPSGPKEPDDNFASHLELALAPDGEHFEPPRRITVDGARACPCCLPAVAIDREGRILVAYRSSRANIKESALLVSKDRGQTFTGTQLSNHRWKFIGCPMSGPVIATDARDAVVAWTSGENMFCAWSRDGASTFGSAVRLGRGQFLAASVGTRPMLVWDEGHQTGLWPASSSSPDPRASIRPAGALVPDPQGGFALIQSP